MAESGVGDEESHPEASLHRESGTTPEGCREAQSLSGPTLFPLFL